MDKFIDAIGTIRVTRGLVRIQTIRQSQNADGTTGVEDRGDLVIPLTAFLNLHSGLNAAVNQMVDQGMLTRKTEDSVSLSDAGVSEDAGAESDLVDAPVTSSKSKKR